MSVNLSPIKAKREVRLKAVALPIEHGSWGFLFEPLLGGLLIAPTFNSVWIAIMVIGAFLTRQPLKVYLTDWRAGRKLPQTELALKFIFIYGAIFLVGISGSLFFVKPNSFLPFLLIAPLAIYQIYCDASQQSRQLLPELTGAVAISSSIAVIALSNELDPALAYSFWAIFVARLIPSILYVRNRLKLEKGKEFFLIPVLASHFIAVGAIGMLAGNGLGSKLTLAVSVILLARAFWGLSPFRKKSKAVKIGIWEVIYGTLTMLSVVIGYYLKI